MTLHIFLEKKTGDDEEKYPDEIMKTIIKRKKESRREEIKSNKKIFGLVELNIDSKSVFGPKLHMKNMINKKKLFQDEG